jgi:hypothetical protein
MVLSVVLFCLAGLGALVMGLKYSFSPVPMGCHAEMLGSEADPPSDGLQNVLTGLYRAFGGALSGLALAIIILALWRIAAGLEVVLVAALIAFLL